MKLQPKASASIAATVLRIRRKKKKGDSAHIRTATASLAELGMNLADLCYL
jgi:hypothetical protein